MPLLPFEISASVPFAAKSVVVVIASSFVTDRLVNVSPLEARLNAPAPELPTVTAPVVFKVKLGVDVAKPPSPISPEPELTDRDVVPDKVPAVCVTAPDPLADNVTIVPPALAPKVMPPLLAVAVSDKAPADSSEFVAVVVILLLFDTEKLVNVSPPEVRLNGCPLLITVALPVVFKVKLGVDVARLPILPDPELNDTDVVPVIVAPPDVIAPDPLAIKLTVPPLMLLSFKAMAPLLPFVVRDNAPLAVKAFSSVRVLSVVIDKLVNVEPKLYS